MKVEVVPHNSEWAQKFQHEADELNTIFGQNVIEIHHIGSTSVPGLQAKPIIDIMPVVRRIEQVDACNAQMEAFGYECMGEFGIPGRRYFRKGGDNRTHQVHVFEYGDANVVRHLAFRDYLKVHPEDAQTYGNIKAELAKQFPNDIEAYMDGKDALVKEIEKKALAWYQEGRH